MRLINGLRGGSEGRVSSTMKLLVLCSLVAAVAAWPSLADIEGFQGDQPGRMAYYGELRQFSFVSSK